MCGLIVCLTDCTILYIEDKIVRKQDDFSDYLAYWTDGSVQLNVEFPAVMRRVPGESDDERVK